MGLEITAYEHVNQVGDIADDYDYYHTNLYQCERRALELPEGLYAVSGKRIEFRAGSYGGYNQWRNWLSKTMLNQPDKYVWTHSDELAGQPFVELINFSDCEGTIGPSVCAKLAKDFADNREKAVNCPNTEYEMRVYNNFAAAFALASNDGAVTFH